MNELIIILETFLAIILFIILIIYIIISIISFFYERKNGGDPYGNNWKTNFGPNGELPKIK